MPETHIDLKSTIPSIKIKTEGVEKLLRNINRSKQHPKQDTKTMCKTTSTITSHHIPEFHRHWSPPKRLAKCEYIQHLQKRRKTLGRKLHISLTSVPCKLIEHIICRNMMNHLEKHNILTSLNHGFRSGYSCETQLAVTIHDMLQSFDRKKQLDITILDFSKAFDTVPHDILLHKLNNYGIRGPLHTWLTVFLTKRKMRVALEGKFSNEATVESGVPQGTVQEPILFLCHINDLPNAVSSKVRLFSDDCLLYREIKQR